MMCTLPHIPKHLHWDRITIQPNFYHNENLYWRRPLEKLKEENPFLTITLADVSINRSGNDEMFFSNPQDVLLKMDTEAETQYFGQGILVLSVNKMDFHKEPKKVFIEEIEPKGKQLIAELHLVHDPLDCNKAHSIFRFKFDGQFVKFSDYKNSFGKDTPKAVKRLRTICKDELRKMIVSKIVEF
jgi:hypothetical protein